jgi:hypothetical protein
LAYEIAAVSCKSAPTWDLPNLKSLIVNMIIQAISKRPPGMVKAVAIFSIPEPLLAKKSIYAKVSGKMHTLPCDAHNAKRLL